MDRAAVAGVASHFALAFKIVRIDLHHHGHHLSGGELGFLVVLFIGVRDVAILTFHAE